MCSCVYNQGFWWLTIMLFLFILLDFIAHKEMVVDITDKKIIVPYVLERTIAWSEVNNVILKDGLLTIDFRNNKLFQQLILNSDDDINEKEFNDFCERQLNN